jgi:uncharacterized protein DUF1592/uncharacterized protein DUF1588/uncharacterized protein DUF1585/uncharacterized protein DUF1595
MKEKRLRLLVALGALPMALACGSATDNNGNGSSGGNGNGSAAGPNASAGSPAVGAGGGSAAGPSVGTGGSGGPVLPPTGQCVPGIPVTTQIPLLLNRQYANVVRDLVGVTAVDNTPVEDLLVGDFTGAMTDPAWKVYQDVGAKIAAQVMAGPNKSKFISCAPTAADCLKTTIQTFGRKAFRRALTDEEVTSFLSLNSVTPAGTPDQVAEAILNAFLVSPSFLLIPELNTETEGTAIKLSQQEVATRLSFLLWGSVPDDALTKAADDKLLSTREQILAQATRMIQVREKTGGFISAFHDDWAQMNNSSAHWFKGKHDTAVYPDYTDASRVANKKELDAFFEEVAYTNGSFKDLLLSTVGFVNKDNAAAYGLDPSKYTDVLTKVTLDASRPGFLTRAGFLSSYANFGATSPILRGSFMAIWLLSINVPAPDPSFSMKTITGNYPTQRAYVEALTQTEQPCKSCHEVFNPLGYIMEGYDGIGKLQTKDPKGGDITAAVTTATVNFASGAKEISSPAQLMQEIAKQPDAKKLYAQAWVSFATGRPPNGNDECTVNALQTKLADDGYSILGLLGDLTQADSFRLRVRGSL